MRGSSQIDSLLRDFPKDFLRSATSFSLVKKVCIRVLSSLAALLVNVMTATSSGLYDSLRLNQQIDSKVSYK